LHCIGVGDESEMNLSKVSLFSPKYFSNFGEFTYSAAR
jgi:hypothetical protein